MHNKIKNRHFFFLLIFILLASGCQTIHVTKQYYDDYVNPKASIDYDFSPDLGVANDNLDVYFQIDSSLTKLKNELNYMENITREAVVNSKSLSQPWVVGVAFFDDAFSFIAGSQSIHTNEELAGFLQTSAQRSETSSMVVLDDAYFFVHTLKIENDLFRTAVVQLDMQELLKNIHAPNFILAINALIAYGPQNQGLVDAVHNRAAHENVFPEQCVTKTPPQWIRSLAADNLFYIFMD